MIKPCYESIANLQLLHVPKWSTCTSSTAFFILQLLLTNGITHYLPSSRIKTVFSGLQLDYPLLNFKTVDLRYAPVSKTTQLISIHSPGNVLARSALFNPVSEERSLGE